MPYTLEFNIPGLPKTTNSSKTSWRAKHAEATSWKKAVTLYARNRGLPPIPLKRAKLTLIRFSSVEPDYDGLVSSFKHVIDGLISAKVIENDRYSNIGASQYEWKKCPRQTGSISVRVEEIVSNINKESE